MSDPTTAATDAPQCHSSQREEAAASKELKGDHADVVGVALQAPQADELDEEMKRSFLWNTHSYLSEYARFADTKAAFAGALSGAMIGVVYTAGLFEPVISISPSRWLFANWLGFLAGFFLCTSVGLAICTVYPRLKSTHFKGFIFWGNLASFHDVAELRTSFHAQSARSLNDHLLTQAFDVSKHVCVPKYKMVSWCLITLALGTLLAAGALLLKGRTSLPIPPAKASSLECLHGQTVAPLPS